MSHSSSDLAPRRPWLSTGERWVVAFTLAYTAAWLALAVWLGNSEFLFYVAVMAILIVAVGALYLRTRFHIGALWGLSIWGLLHMAGGLMPIPASWPRGGESNVLYNWWLIPGWLKYDQLVHAYGFGLVTWICWQCLGRALENRGTRAEPTAGLLALCIAAGMGFGAANEVVEFAATQLLPGTNVGGYVNTGWDLVANMVGCMLAGATIRFGILPSAR